MPEYLDFEIDTDPQDLEALAFDELQAQIPGWIPAEGNLETLMIGAIAAMAAEVRDVAALVPTTIFRYFGTLTGILPLEATSATVATTWTAVDNAGYVVPAGSLAALRISGDEIIEFEVVADVTLPPGSIQTTLGTVLMRAVEPGAEPNGLGTDAQDLELLSTELTWVAAVELYLPTGTKISGGTDAETDAEYLDRLATRLRLLTPRPVTPADFEIAARDYAAVGRANAADRVQADHNLLTANQSSVEIDLSGFSADTNCGINRVSSPFLHGAFSLQMSSTASGDMVAGTSQGTSGVVALPNTDYTALASIRPQSFARNCSVGIRYFTSGGATISTTYSNDVSVLAATWTQIAVTARAPSNAAFMCVLFRVKATAAPTELAHIDQIAMRRGYNQTWQLGTIPATGVDRAVTVSVISDTGALLTSADKTAITALLKSEREYNFLVTAEDPQITAIDVTAAFVTAPTYSATEVTTAVIAALQSYLSPANWGRPTQPGSDPDGWLTVSTVRQTELVEVINRVEGVSYVTSLTLAISGQTLGTADVAIGGASPLTSAGTISVTGT